MAVTLWDLLCISIGFIVIRLGSRNGWNRERAGSDENTISREDTLDTLSVIIPARNEEKNLQKLLPMLMNQTNPPHEVIVVDDSSDDNTARVAESLGARVILAPPLPEGWIGKSWACWNGAASADGSAFVFLDADTEPEPPFLEEVAKELKHKRGLLTIQPYHHVPSFKEQWSAFFNVVVTVGSGASSSLRWKGSGFGPCAACSRSDYYKVGGHESVRGEVLEHERLGERFRASGLDSKLLLGRGLLSFRMYPDGFQSLAQGWMKSISKGAGATPLPLLILVLLWFSGLISAAVRCLTITGGASLLQWLTAISLYGIAIASLTGALRASGSFRWYVYLFYPLYMLLFIILFALSLFRTLLRKKAAWKGRSIDVR